MPQAEKRYFAVDILTMAYAFLAFIAVAALGHDFPGRVGALACYLILFVFVRLAVPWCRRSPVRTIRFLVQFYPMFAFAILYYYSNVTNTILFRDAVDPWFAELDRAWFGSRIEEGGAVVGPSHWLAKRFGAPLTDEIIHACYFSYYTQFPLTGLAIYLRHGAGYTYQRFLFALCLTFYASYAVFTILPVHGPCTLRGADYHGWIFVPVMDWIYASAETGGGAFPSSHVAVSLVCMIGAWRHARPLFWIYLVPSIGLFVGTVYCRYHYAVDALAGIPWGIACFAAGTAIFRWAAGPKPGATTDPALPKREA